MKKTIRVALTGLFILMIMTGGFAAEDEEQEAGYYTSGTVVSISALKLVLNEPELEGGKEEKVTYLIDKDIVLYNVNALKEITAGKKVEVIYKEKGGKNVVTVITLVKTLNDADLREEEEEGLEEPKEAEEDEREEEGEAEE